MADTGSGYVPSIVPQQAGSIELQEYLAREFATVAAAIGRIDRVFLQQQNVAFTKPEQGMIFYADGTNFNPTGEGEGIYARTSAGYVKLDNAGIFNSPTLVLKQSAAPTPTAEGAIEWDTDDNAIVVGDGAGQKIFRASNMELIGIANPSGAASVVFTNLSAFRALRMTGRVRPATDGVALQFRTSTNNGVSYDAGAADYGLSYLYQIGGAAGGTGGGSAASFAPGVSSIGNVAPESMHFELTVQEFNQALQCYFLCWYGEYDGATASFVGITHGRRAQATARNAIQVAMSSGNIADGHIELWGTRGTP